MDSFDADKFNLLIWGEHSLRCYLRCEFLKFGINDSVHSKITQYSVQFHQIHSQLRYLFLFQLFLIFFCCVKYFIIIFRNRLDMRIIISIEMQIIFDIYFFFFFAELQRNFQFYQNIFLFYIFSF